MLLLQAMIAVFSAFDNEKAQLYHFTQIAGMGFFTNAYYLFSITAVIKLMGHLYYYNPTIQNRGTLPDNVNNAISGLALCGTLAGQLFFWWLGDKLGRRKVYGITLVTMVGSSIASVFSMGSTAKTVMSCLCFFRFWLGFGIGGDYLLWAIIMSEYTNQKMQGGLIAAIFAMQGTGIMVTGSVAMSLFMVFCVYYPPLSFLPNNVPLIQLEGDFVWRIVLMLGVIPAVLTYYWRMKMPETAWFVVKGDDKEAVADMAKVLESDIQAAEVETGMRKSYVSLLKEFMACYWAYLIGIYMTWFFLDINFFGTPMKCFLLNVAFYGHCITQKDTFSAIGLQQKAQQMNAIEEAFGISRKMFLVALFARVDSVFLIHTIGRLVIQLSGFSLCPRSQRME